jgi:hypothetical protein
MRTLHVITPCSRFSTLSDLAKNFTDQFSKVPLNYRVRWHVAFQKKDEHDPCGVFKDNEMIDLIPDEDWIWILDDDNTVHHFFFTVMQSLFDSLNEDVKAIVLSQARADALGPVLEARPANMCVGGIDTAQLVFKKQILGPLRFCNHPKTPDGLLYEKLFKIHGPKAFLFVTDALVNYNGLRLR